MVRDVVVLILCHFGQSIVCFEDGQSLAEVLQCFGFHQIKWVGYPAHILADGVEGQVAFVQVATQVVQGLFLARTLDTLQILFMLKVEREK